VHALQETLFAAHAGSTGALAGKEEASKAEKEKERQKEAERNDERERRKARTASATNVCMHLVWQFLTQQQLQLNQLEV
jgi:hypothetical protein